MCVRMRWRLCTRRRLLGIDSGGRCLRFVPDFLFFDKNEEGDRARKERAESERLLIKVRQ